MSGEIKSNPEYLEYLASLCLDAKTEAENIKKEFTNFINDIYYEGAGQNVLELIEDRYYDHLSLLIVSYDIMANKIKKAGEVIEETDEQIKRTIEDDIP